MANYAEVTYRVAGPLESLEKLAAACKASDWQSEVLESLGLNPEEFLPLRGEILGHALIHADSAHPDMLEIWQDCSWNEQPGFRRGIEAALPDCHVAYQTEEPGCGIYTTNDFDLFPEHYKFDACIDDEYVDEYFCSLQVLADWLESSYGIKPDTLSFESLAAAVDAYDAAIRRDSDDAYATLHEFTLIDNDL